MSKGLTERIHSHTPLPYPNDGCTILSDYRHRLMSYIRAWPKHKHAQIRRRYVNCALAIGHGNCIVVPLDNAMLKVEKRQSILNSDKLT
ncbi:hypothetical protein KIM372_02770 [Bombiscardovia nodaiensis]|uniref:Uncharacterized protein n=1 Tax=Bombiscardovia nodaiensis TaxID=2932181 RepID=A0ABM8B6S2_9BIFI|nr:hypothetical protein KIM372_02770 [Bombiscardovia nodaiensis]